MSVELLENISPNSYKEGLRPEPISTPVLATNVDAVPSSCPSLPNKEEINSSKVLDNRDTKKSKAWLAGSISHGRKISRLKHILVPMFKQALNNDTDRLLFQMFEKGFRGFLNKVFSTDDEIIALREVEQLRAALLYLISTWKSFEEAKEPRSLVNTLCHEVDPRVMFGAMNNILSAVLNKNTSEDKSRFKKN